MTGNSSSLTDYDDDDRAVDDVRATALPLSIASRRHALLGGALAFCACVAAVDLCTYHVNWPALYFIPLLMIEQYGRRRALWPAAAALVALTFGGYFLGVAAPEQRIWSDMFGPRLANRTLVAGALLVAAGLLEAGLLERERRSRRGRVEWPHDPDGRAYAQIVQSINRIVSPLVAGVLVLVLLIGDARVSADYNIAILFWLPLVILTRARSPVILWSGLLVLIAAALLGLQFGHAPSDRSHMNNLLLNRLLVCAAMVGITALLQIRMNHTAAAARRVDVNEQSPRAR